MSSTPNKPLILDTRSHTVSPPSSFAESGRGNATWHTLLSAPGTATTSLTGGIAVCPPTGTLALHRHKQAEVYYILDGSGEVEVEGERYKVSKDMLVWVPGDAEHGVFCGEGEQLRWLYMFPEGSFEQVIYRFTHELKDLAGGLKAKL
ncbi:Cupin -type [Fusarium albosuccineum]|uniref:Cupin -type n=1 Tax=Fusarium albosuccineum TaxID=1237068 RepID=A0A8H4LPH0_9HYPO|nr:Cupin -type [Fusarium albosuccineum]